VPGVFAPWARLALSLRAPKPGQSALDVACGTGIGARLLALAVGPGGHVAGVDSDEGMLAVARSVPDGAAAAPIVWHQSSAQILPLEKASVDFVTCFEGIQFFRDRAKAMSEMRRVLRPGGAVLFTIWGPLSRNPGHAAIAEALKHFVGVEAANLTPYSMTEPKDIRGLFLGAGFTELAIETSELILPVPSAKDFIDWMAAGAFSTRHNLAKLDPAKLVEFYAMVAERLAQYAQAGDIGLPTCRNICIAEAP
jgi:ubiquinone/menaquinone biosynthesis C-methylase UbiE